jgi:RNA polymerase sigma-70 factor, ECF subfamily
LLDSEAVARAQQGEAAGWEHIVQAHQSAVFRLAYLLLGDADEAADAAQETFLRAYPALARFDQTRPLRPWLLRITANLAHNRRRAAGRYLAALQRAFQAEPEQGRPPPVEQLAAQQAEAQALWQAVRRLARPDQEVVYLRFFLELPEAEMAAALGVAPGTVKSRLHRALRRLRAVIQAHYPELRERFAPAENSDAL